MQVTNDPDSNWANSRFEYSVEADAITGEYATEVGKLMTVENVYYVTDPATPVDPAGYSVFYFTLSSGYDVLRDINTLVDDTAAVDVRPGGVPNAEGKYAIVTVQGQVDTSTFVNETTWTQFLGKLSGAEYRIDLFEVKTAAKDFGEMGVFEYNSGATDKGVSDTELVYNGQAINVGVTDGGKILKWANVKSTAALLGQPANAGAVTVQQDGENAYLKVENAQAGDYKVRIDGQDGTAYEGKSVEVSFTIQKLDLSESLLSIKPVAKKSSTEAKIGYTAADRKVANTNLGLLANGVPVNTADYEAFLTAVDGDKSAVASKADCNLDETVGAYTLLVRAPQNSANVTGGPIEVELDVVGTTAGIVDYLYAGNTMFPTEFKPFANYSFNPASITAQANSVVVPFAYKVYKDGTEVTSYDEPGKYLLELTTEYTKTSTADYAGHEVIPFTVLGQTVDYSDAKAYYSIDGKAIPAAGVEYTGSAVVPAVSVLYKGEALVAGTDYTVSYRDAEGNAVESVVDPGEYEIVVTLNDTAKTEIAKDLKVNKAEIKSAEPTADFFPTDGETPAAPSFVGSTDEDFDKGVKFDLAADEISVVYYAWDDDDKDGFVDDGETGDQVAAEDLTEKGIYWAQINVLTTAANIMGSGVMVPFQVLETAVFTDVPADAWYAQDVYKASELLYMRGVAVGIFAPEQAMTRAEFAKLVANMAGNFYDPSVSYPTVFTDVPADAWFAGAVEWAARYGIVTGTSATTFDPYGTITREQIATMLYRYAGNGAQADLSVLDKYADASQVSDWARPAMAWAVENGYVNGVSDTQLAPAETATRAQIAAIAVRVQPEALWE